MIPSAVASLPALSIDAIGAAAGTATINATDTNIATSIAAA